MSLKVLFAGGGISNPMSVLLNDGVVNPTRARGIEENSKRKFRAYYGGDWLRVTHAHDIGTFTYLLRDKLKVVTVPYYQPTTTPTDINTRRPNKLIQWLRQYIYRK